MKYKTYKRIFVIVCDSMGIGNAEDAALYGDDGTNTIGHISEVKQGLHVPCLQRLGLAELGDFVGVEKGPFIGKVATLKEVSNAKDTLTGHWEMMGLKVTEPLKVFTDTGFPDEFIQLFEEKTGRKCVGNYAASGTEILDELGEHQYQTGDWIVYTSADSVFQIAANEEIIPLDELYNACQIARELLMDERWKVGRVIARPYIGQKKGAFKRTANRHDYALAPFGKTVLNALQENHYDVISVGKIADIFSHSGITEAYHTVSNEDGMDKTIALLDKDFCGLTFTNLVDFDAVYGHRRNPIGYGDAIETFDRQLQVFIDAMKADDLVIITADHGNDPTWTGTDHTREQVPFIAYSPSMKTSKNLGLLESFAIIGATVAENFYTENPGIGFSILEQVK